MRQETSVGEVPLVVEIVELYPEILGESYLNESPNAGVMTTHSNSAVWTISVSLTFDINSGRRCCLTILIFILIVTFIRGVVKHLKSCGGILNSPFVNHCCECILVGNDILVVI